MPQAKASVGWESRKLCQKQKALVNWGSRKNAPQLDRQPTEAFSLREKASVDWRSSKTELQEENKNTVGRGTTKMCHKKSRKIVVIVLVLLTIVSKKLSGRNP